MLARELVAICLRALTEKENGGGGPREDWIDRVDLREAISECLSEESFSRKWIARDAWPVPIFEFLGPDEFFAECAAHGLTTPQALTPSRSVEWIALAHWGRE